MQNADTGDVHAKASGRSNYQFFKADMNTRAVRRQSVESSRAARSRRICAIISRRSILLPAR
jgi:hypothetical protein